MYWFRPRTRTEMDDMMIDESRIVSQNLETEIFGDDENDDEENENEYEFVGGLLFYSFL